MSKPALTLEQKLEAAEAALVTANAENASLKESIKTAPKADTPDAKADDTPPKKEDTPAPKSDVTPAPQAEAPEGFKALTDLVETQAKAITELAAKVGTVTDAMAKHSIDLHANGAEDTPHNVAGSDNGKDKNKPKLKGIEATADAFGDDVKGLDLQENQ
jgi:hypothetical protein